MRTVRDDFWKSCAREGCSRWGNGGREVLDLGQGLGKTGK